MEACAAWFLSVPFSSWVLVSQIPVQFVLMSVCYGEVETQQWWSGVSSLMEDSCPGNTGDGRRAPSLTFKEIHIFWKRDSAHSPGSWMRWRKLLVVIPGLSEAMVSVHGLDGSENLLKGDWSWGADRKGSKEIWLPSVNWVLERSPKTKQSLCAFSPTTESC